MKRLRWWTQYCKAFIANSIVMLVRRFKTPIVSLSVASHYDCMAHTYNLRLVADWLRNNNPSAFAKLPDERHALIAVLESIAVPSVVTSRFMWEPYLT